MWSEKYFSKKMLDSEPLLSFHLCQQNTAPLAGQWSGPSHVHITSSCACVSSWTGQIKYEALTPPACRHRTGNGDLDISVWVTDLHKPRHSFCQNWHTFTNNYGKYSVGGRGWGTVYQEVPQIRDEILGYLTDNTDHVQQSWKHAESTVRFLHREYRRSFQRVKYLMLNFGHYYVTA